MDQNTLPATTEFRTPEYLETLSKKEIAVVYMGEKNSEFLQFENLSQTYKDVDFYHTFNPKVIDANPGTKVLMIKGKEYLKIPFSGDLTFENLLIWYNTNR